MPEVTAIIPARWASTRFPGKPLVVLRGKPLVQHVWERASRAKLVDRVIVATDDMRIASAAFDFGAEVALTSSRHPTGTDRLAEVASGLKSAPIILNVQGDEPDIAPSTIDRLVRALQDDPSLGMVTAANPISAPSDIGNPNVVKVVTDLSGRALYFSRSLIPHHRDGSGGVGYLRHQGIYGYRRKVLLDFVKWKPTPLEKAEKLEQLRALEHGVSIGVIVVKRASVGVDVPADVAKAARALRGGGSRQTSGRTL
ncbi:MAG: 3-deoxy-manno-octulosonate cytidylyltransferase [Chthoniobacterales bacterium]|nr:3-deoxy-manno-octulosonate cytidylyltransferase [Chthoniobacterales bacterium]